MFWCGRHKGAKGRRSDRAFEGDDEMSLWLRTAVLFCQPAPDYFPLPACGINRHTARTHCYQQGHQKSEAYHRSRSAPTSSQIVAVRASSASVSTHIRRESSALPHLHCSHCSAIRIFWDLPPGIGLQPQNSKIPQAALSVGAQGSLACSAPCKLNRTF